MRLVSLHIECASRANRASFCVAARKAQTAAREYRPNRARLSEVVINYVSSFRAPYDRVNQLPAVVCPVAQVASGEKNVLLRSG